MATRADIESALALWRASEGLGLNESDTPDALTVFLARNPALSAVAIAADGRLVGAVLCGHDGRRGTLHHLAVAPDWRGRGIARRLVAHGIAGFQAIGIPPLQSVHLRR